jgi:hypothetical protein
LRLLVEEDRREKAAIRALAIAKQKGLATDGLRPTS